MPDRRGANWQDLRPRLISAAVLIVVAGAAIGAGGLFYGVLVIAAMCGMASEVATLFRTSVRSWRGVLYVAWMGCAGLAAFYGHWSAVPAFVMSAFIFGPPLWAGSAVIIAAGAALLWLRLCTPPGAWSVLFAIAVVVCSDSTAYVVGRVAGGPKLAPRISPGKTRSGAMGGLAGALIAGVVVASLWGADSVVLMRSAVWAVLLGVLAQAGDLAESAVKRARGVKDSGTLLPGHGGLLDRFDALLAVAPLAAMLSLAARPGQGFWSVGPGDVWAALLRLTGQ
ncbi:phosphatidate cytidylyltransferase [Acetobacter sp. LMG 1636]|uniref:Phosphatidate cytidylyltransferase n=1 Tax=Acetobacter fallax TaxID=1737473 RepID=A0ABX0K736_9PROT|nr:phosphatidate cytidylyltransferase [Acetobacter fallax]NHO35131.1 phosphatidate cytidylyltransferase [Acetobacter fallax]